MELLIASAVGLGSAIIFGWIGRRLVGGGRVSVRQVVDDCSSAVGGDTEVVRTAVEEESGGGGIGDDERGTDGATDTDGIHAVSQSLGDEFPNGLFLAQDWYNIDSQYKAENQNFKIVDWRDIQAVLK